LSALVRIGRRGLKYSWPAWSRGFGLGIFLIGMAGCAATPPAVTYDLNPVEPNLTARPPHGELAVAMPTAISVLDSPRIVVRTAAGLEYLKGVEWSGRLPVLLQKKLIESFERSHRLAAVGGPSLAAKYTLVTDIRRFEVDVTRSVAVVEFYVQLVGAGGQIIATQDFIGEAPAPHDDGATVSAVLDAALAKVLRQIVIWAPPKL
jgi:cholesterol transport system auxiliary component